MGSLCHVKNTNPFSEGLKPNTNVSLKGIKRLSLECTRKSGDFKRQSDKISQRGSSGYEKRTETE